MFQPVYKTNQNKRDEKITYNTKSSFQHTNLQAISKSAYDKT